MDIVQDFQAFCSAKVGQNQNVRLNKQALIHITEFLLHYYPFMAAWSIGKRADFVIFLAEKAIKEKIPDYEYSWITHFTDKKKFPNAPFA